MTTRKIHYAGQIQIAGGRPQNVELFLNEVDPQPHDIYTQDGDYTLVMADANQTIHKAAGASGETITIPANSITPFPLGTMMAIQNDGGGTLTIAITTDTLTWAEDNTTGSRTIADGGYLVIQKVTYTGWKCAGVNVS